MFNVFVGSGSLICCEICPAAFHLDCLKLEHPPEKYYCDNCETGRMPLYNEIVWAKIGAYRWWPALVVPPEKLPNKIERLPHEVTIIIHCTYLQKVKI